MSRSKFTSAYPMEYTDLLKEILLDPEKPVRLPFPSVKAAKNFRINFQSFKVAAIHEGWNAENDKLGLGALRYSMPAVTVLVDEVDMAAMIVHKDYSEDAKIIRAALEAKNGPKDQ